MCTLLFFRHITRENASTNLESVGLSIGCMEFLMNVLILMWWLNVTVVNRFSVFQTNSTWESALVMFTFISCLLIAIYMYGIYYGKPIFVLIHALFKACICLSLLAGIPILMKEQHHVCQMFNISLHVLWTLFATYFGMQLYFVRLMYSLFESLSMEHENNFYERSITAEFDAHFDSKFLIIKDQPLK